VNPDKVPAEPKKPDAKQDDKKEKKT